MGALIGKGGEDINQIRRESQSNIQIQKLNEDLEVVTITGNVEKAQELIFKKLQEKLPFLFKKPGDDSSASQWSGSQWSASAAGPPASQWQASGSQWQAPQSQWQAPQWQAPQWGA